jgi:glycosyltransferase involved in cell wall biosynthesis
MVEPITVLMPCRAQAREFFDDAVRSIVAQTVSEWRLVVIVDVDSPPELAEWIAACADARIETIVSAGGLARALNAGMRHAPTTWVAILLSDDRWDPSAVAVLQRTIAAHPEADFLHSARCEIDAAGRRRGVVAPSRARVDVDAFVTLGSPVKHLLCWRRERGLAIGGMDETLTIGPDDYDFPWRMLEAGCRFHAVPECLYEYRVHHAGPRITTDHPLRGQLRSLARMFDGHGVSAKATAAFLQHATGSYLVKELLFDFEDDWRARVDWTCTREADASRRGDFLAAGFHARHFFPHRVLQLPKAGVDGLKLATRMSGIDDPARLGQVVLFALPPATDEFPEALFLDDDVQWHQQHFGRPGQVASANLAFDGDRMFGSAYVSDLVQRIPRRREHKTRVENVFKGWHHLLLHALLNVALDRGVGVLCSPTADLAMRHTDPRRTVGHELFRRVYDETVTGRYRAEERDGWWRIDVAANRERIVVLDKDVEVVRRTKTIALCHDVERGYGHRATDPEHAVRADAGAEAALEAMLAIERAAGVRATYSVVGLFLDEVRDRIVRDGHALAFHSWDHPVAATQTLRARVRDRLTGRPRAHAHDARQLGLCRDADYRLKGYRPPQSRLTRGIADRHLSHHGFEWLASSAASLRRTTPALENGIVKIPILFDDYAMFRDGEPFEQWRDEALAAIDAHEFVAFSLHDCYAEHWLPHYADFLAAVRARGRLRTLDQVAADVALAHARWT